MQAGQPKFELIVLSQARDIAVRKLRGFAASIGANARLVGSAAEVLDPRSAIAFRPETAAKLPIILLWDCGTIHLDPRDIQTLGASCFLVAVGDPSKLTEVIPPKHATDPDTDHQEPIRMTLSCTWPLTRLLDTQIARVVLGQAMIGQSFVDGFALLRWGHYHSGWPTSEPSPKDVASATFSGLAAAFGKAISAQSELKKKLVAVARLFDGPGNKSRVHPLSLAFASDGLLTCAIAACYVDLKAKLDLSPSSLEKLGCRAVIMSEHQRNIWQLAFVFSHSTVVTSHNVDGDLPLSTPILITFPKKDVDDSVRAVPPISAAS